MSNVIAKNPFPMKDSGSAYVTFLSEFPDDLPKEGIDRAKGPSEKIVFSGREIYLLCPNGYGKSRLS